MGDEYKQKIDVPVAYCYRPGGEYDNKEIAKQHWALIDGYAVRNELSNIYMEYDPCNADNFANHAAKILMPTWSRQVYGGGSAWVPHSRRAEFVKRIRQLCDSGIGNGVIEGPVPIESIERIVKWISRYWEVEEEKESKEDGR
jgi:hypothetical protein